MAKGWLNNIGRVIRTFNEDGSTKSHFIKFERPKDKDGNYKGESPFPLVIEEGAILRMKPKNEDLAGLVKNGTISQETADKIYKHVRFELSKGPDEAKDSKKSEAKKNTGGEVDF